MSYRAFQANSIFNADDSLSIKFSSSSSNLLLTTSRPPWLSILPIFSEKTLPSRIILPCGIDALISTSVDHEWSWSLGDSEQVMKGKKLRIKTPETAKNGFVVEDGRGIELSCLPLGPVPDRHPLVSIDPLESFSIMDDYGVFSNSELSLSIKTKNESDLFFGVGSKDGIALNGRTGCPLLCQLGATYRFDFLQLTSYDTISVCTSPRMQGKDIVAKSQGGNLYVKDDVVNYDKLWWGIEGLPFSGGRFFAAKKSFHGDLIARDLGFKPPSEFNLEAKSPRDSCVLNCASIGAWCCAQLTFDSPQQYFKSAPKTVCSQLMAFDGTNWQPTVSADSIGRDEVDAGLLSRGIYSSSVMIVEPGVMDGLARFPSDSVSFLREKMREFTNGGGRCFACAAPQGINLYDPNSIKRMVKITESNTYPGSFVAVYVAPGASRQVIEILTEVANGSGREVFALVLDANTISLLDEYPINVLTTYELSLLVDVRSGRSISIFDESSLVRA